MMMMWMGHAITALENFTLSSVRCLLACLECLHDKCDQELARFILHLYSGFLLQHGGFFALRPRFGRFAFSSNSLLSNLIVSSLMINPTKF